jgi:hypothetical protein
MLGFFVVLKGFFEKKLDKIVFFFLVLLSHNNRNFRNNSKEIEIFLNIFTIITASLFLEKLI